jgi:putative tricarboxylic transport membrane protein
MVIGAILGPLAELYYKRTIQISQGDHSVLFDGLLTKSLYTFLLLLIVLPPLYRLIMRGKQSSKK